LPILKVCKLDGDAVTGTLFDILPANFPQQAIAAGADKVHLNCNTCTCGVVQSAHRAGLRTMV
jgi:hypothetical protein